MRRVRVVAGTARGRRLVTPPGSSTRPTTDRVREAVFNALHSLGALEGATVLDLFAGSGAMGIEALSRGAAAATFVDDDPAALAAVKANLVATGLADRAAVVRSDASAYLRRRDLPAADLVVLDPPYATDDDTWAALLAAVPARLAVLESDRDLDIDEQWRVRRRKRYGTTVVTMVERAG